MEYETNKERKVRVYRDNYDEWDGCIECRLGRNSKCHRWKRLFCHPRFKTDRSWKKYRKQQWRTHD